MIDMKQDKKIYVILSIIGIAIIFGSGIVVYKKLQKQNKFI